MNKTATRQLARQLVRRLRQNNGGVILLDGPMGAGKTTLVGYMVQMLVPKALPCSPTYTLINQYSNHVYHADLYRLYNDGVLDWQTVQNETGLLDLCVPGNYVFIEWPGDITILGAIRVTLKIKEDGNREFVIA